MIELVLAVMAGVEIVNKMGGVVDIEYAIIRSS